MPGIAGIIGTRPDEEHSQNLRVMIDYMMHEPFYNSGSYINKDLGVYVGWVSHKESFSDCMPVVNEIGDIVLIFSGENFVDNDVIDALRNRGHKVDNSNATYLIHLYERDEQKFLENLNGWFSGILIDLRKKTAVLFNDRYAMHRIYYYEEEGAFLFCSEAKSLLKVRPQLRQLDIEGLAQFFACGCTLQNRSLFSNILLLPGASAWTFCNGGSLRKKTYFEATTWERLPALTKEDFSDRLKETLRRIFPRYLHSRQSIGLSLTAGLDTRILLSCLDIGRGQLPCYTFGNTYSDTLDVRVARRVAEACGQPHRVLQLDGLFFSEFPSLAEKTIYVTDGYLDVCGSHDLYLNRFARNVAAVRLTGKFGSEVLRGASTFKSDPPSAGLLNPDFRKCVDNARNGFAELTDAHRLSFSVFKDAPWHEYGRIAMEQSQLVFRTPYMDNHLVALMYRAPADLRNSKEISLRLIQDANPTLYGIMTDLGYGGHPSYLFGKILQLLRWLSFKAEWYYNEGMPDRLTKIDKGLRLLFRRRLILQAHKFLHYRIWFQDELSYYIQEMLLDKRTTGRPYLNKGFVEEMVRRHIHGDRNYLNEINRTLSLELIHRLLIEGL